MKKLYFTFAILLLQSNIGYSQAQQPFCTDASRECVLSAASSYLKALTSHDPSLIPFADNAVRWENGIMTGSSGAAMRDQLKNDPHVQAIQNVREVHWLVDGNQAVAYYLLDVKIPNTEVHIDTTHIAERFQVENGKIVEIEAIFCNSIGTTPETSKIAPPTTLSFLCHRTLAR